MQPGKDFRITEEGLLHFREGIQHPEPDVRLLEDAKTVLYKEDDTLQGPKPLYFMYRGVFSKEDWELYLEKQIRYDLTVLLPGTIDREFIKTVGHFHPLRPDGQGTYPEYYEVLSGEALYLLQKNTRSGDIEEIMAVEAKKGDKVFIPPGYGHVTINPCEEPLVMANLIEKNFSSLYAPFRDKKGAAYYFLKTENGRGEFVKNENYHVSVGLQMLAAPSLPQPLDLKGKTLYEAFLEEPEDIEKLLA